MSAARRRMRREENHQCPVYEPNLAGYDWYTDTGLTQGIRSRTDIDYARYLTGMGPEKIDAYLASPDGWCETPQYDLFVSRIPLAVIKIVDSNSSSHMTSCCQLTDK